VAFLVLFHKIKVVLGDYSSLFLQVKDEFVFTLCAYLL